MNVLIIEDDPMVAKLNEDFLKTIPTINIVGNYRTTQDAKKLLQEKRVDAILLDNYLPNETGIEFLVELRKENNQVPVILITAANDIETIQQALALGVIDYLVKPFTAERFLSSIQKVMNQKKLFSQLKYANQQNIDALFNEHSTNNTSANFSLGNDLPKGLAKLTMEKVLEKINEETTSFSTEELAKKIGISRISTKKYLTFLVESNYLTEDIVYQEVGRPTIRYKRT
ncbi:response regulator [Vagococcus luciliae]|uniref:Transcriptional regulatory protein n=1 Tax=Vagococcus luciliae TaxID=2920380 RepID=A0ABY5NXG2_9ENTE|nr:response regulator [Vagococcus luciliae]UUV98339.1 Transcriptional regulatory protein DcuR [Vagococcus luciliae]